MDLPLPGAKPLELLGPAGGIQVLDVNENGTMVYYVPDAGLLKRLTITGDAFEGFEFGHEILIESNDGGRSVLVSTEGGFQLNPVAINEEGEVAGTLRRPSNPTINGEGILWSRSGLPQEIAFLVPASAPSGTWVPRRMRGRFLILEHEESGGVYLFHRGR